MAAAPSLIFQDVGRDVPFTVRLAPGDDIELSSVSAVWDAAAAGATFLACLSVYSQSGVLLQRVFPSQTFAPGDSGEVTYGTFLGLGEGAAAAGAVPWVLPTNTNSITAQAGTFTERWTVAISPNPSPDTFDVDGSDNLVILRPGVYSLNLESNMDDSVVTQGRFTLPGTPALNASVFKNWEAGITDTQIAVLANYVIEAADVPLTFPIDLVYTASGAGAFGMGISAMVIRLGDSGL